MSGSTDSALSRDVIVDAQINGRADMFISQQYGHNESRAFSEACIDSVLHNLPRDCGRDWVVDYMYAFDAR